MYIYLIIPLLLNILEKVFQDFSTYFSRNYQEILLCTYNEWTLINVMHTLFKTSLFLFLNILNYIIIKTYILYLNHAYLLILKIYIKQYIIFNQIFFYFNFIKYLLLNVLFIFKKTLFVHL